MHLPIINKKKIKVIKIRKKNSFFNAAWQRKYIYKPFKIIGHNWYYFIFFFLLAGFTELFYHVKETESAIVQDDQLPKLKADLIEKIVLKNRFHRLTLRKEESGIWFTYNDEIRKYPVREDYINNILSSLSSISLQKQIINDATNRANFSLNDPLLEIQVSMTGTTSPYLLKVGISNPITKSSYISIDNNNIIYQIDVISSKLVNFHNEQIFDDRVFVFSLSSIESIQLNLTGQKEHFLKFIKNEQKWLTQNNEDIEFDSISGLIKVLKSVRSIKVLQKEQMNDDVYQSLLPNNQNVALEINFNHAKESYHYICAKYSGRSIASTYVGNITDSYIVKDVDRDELYIMSKNDFAELSEMIKTLKIVAH